MRSQFEFGCVSIDLVSVWEEVDCYSERERAAFAWAESVTKVSETHVPDEVFGFASKHFSAEELTKLTLAVVTINAWNRFCIAFRRLCPCLPLNVVILPTMAKMLEREQI